MLWTLNPNFDIRLAGSIAIPLGASLTARTWGTAIRQAAAGAYTTSARCWRQRSRLTQKLRFWRASRERVSSSSFAGSRDIPAPLTSC